MSVHPKNFFFVFLASSTLSLIIFIINFILAKLLGFWHGGYIARLLLILFTAYLSHYFIFSLGSSVLKCEESSTLISVKMMSIIYLVLIICMLFLTATTYILMLKNGTYSESKIMESVMVFISFASYFVGGYFFVKKKVQIK